MKKEKGILVAPLDWGLGHATRCIPLIQALQARGVRPYLASSGRALALLEREFPALPLLPIASYRVRYPGSNLVQAMILQSPWLAGAVWRENRQVQHLVRRYSLTGVISDNRLGAFCRRVRSIYLTHQLHLQTPHGWLTAMADRMHHWFIRQYDECWIPDLASYAAGLAGALSHPPLPVKTRYIGPLSRLHLPALEPERDLLVLLSGPEPQRSRLEEQLLFQLKQTEYSVLLVQGKTEVEAHWQAAPHIECISYLTSEALARALAGSRLVIARSGYSTIMDLARTQLKALFIPTPGQTEQQYLARLLRKRRIAYSVQQSALYLATDIAKAMSFRGFGAVTEAGSDQLEPAIADFLKAC